MRKFSEFFNPFKLEHIKAYSSLCANGSWPENFIPDDMVVSALSTTEAAFLMAEAWMKAALLNEDSKVREVFE